MLRRGYMSDSGEGRSGQYMHLKAVVYNQNSTRDSKGYVRTTFHKIENRHSGDLFN